MKIIKTIGLFAIVFITMASIKNSELASGYDIGDMATDFSLKNVDGEMVSLSNYKDAKGFLIIFTCNTCPYAVAYEDRIISVR